MGQKLEGKNLDITIWRCVQPFSLRYKYRIGLAIVSNPCRPNIVTSRFVIYEVYCSDVVGASQKSQLTSFLHGNSSAEFDLVS
jgi:hypothetical protein